MTYQAKAVISKSMPKLSYLGSVLPMPNNIRTKVNERLLKFVIPHGRTFLDVNDLSARISMGGIAIANVNLHCDIMIIRSVMAYLKQKMDGNPLTPSQMLIEYHLGHKICYQFLDQSNTFLSRTENNFHSENIRA